MKKSVTCVEDERAKPLNVKNQIYGFGKKCNGQYA
jgi:hypothetical protein